MTKIFMEALARMHADKHGIRAMGIRIGYCAIEPLEARMLSHWVHPQDLAALIEVGLHADYHCEIAYGVSANSASWYDNSRAEALGYRPRLNEFQRQQRAIEAHAAASDAHTVSTASHAARIASLERDLQSQMARNDNLERIRAAQAALIDTLASQSTVQSTALAMLRAQVDQLLQERQARAAIQAGERVATASR